MILPIIVSSTVNIWILQIRLKIQSKEWWSLWLRILLLLDRSCFFYLRLIFILCWLFWLGFSCLVLSLLVLTRLKTVVLDQSYAYDSMTWSISDSCWSLQLRSLDTLPLSIFCSFIEVSWNLILSFWFQVVTKPLHSQSIKLNYKLIEIL